MLVHMKRKNIIKMPAIALTLLGGAAQLSIGFQTSEIIWVPKHHAQFIAMPVAACFTIPGKSSQPFSDYTKAHD